MAVATAKQTIDWDDVRTECLGKRDKRILPPWVKLPSLPTALMEFVRKSKDPKSGSSELGRIIQRDAGLTCQLLRHVNSAASGFSQKANSAQEAIARLGVRHSTTFLLTTGMNQVMKSCESKLIDFRGFWCSNLERAMFAREIARHLRADADLAYAGAMLADCLLPVLTNQASPIYLNFLNLQKTEPISLVRFENKNLGWEHCTATGLILSAWEFPPDLVCCILLHHKGLDLFRDKRLVRTAANAVAVSGLLPDQLRQTPDGLKRLLQLNKILPKFDLVETAEKIHEEFEEMSAVTANPFPLIRQLRRMQKDAT